ncbi:MAG TPA: ATP-binding protein, partial [Puia sp.]|nr:ATP-binding protein [Puia sp.]
LAVKEALHNIVKHSQAQHVTIRMEAGRVLTIVLKDDGVGFDRSRIRPYANGLVNMEKRIADLGGHLSVDTGTGGTTVTIVVPV